MDTSRHRSEPRLAAPVCIAVLLALGSGVARAEEAPSPPAAEDTVAHEQEKAQRARELDAVREEQRQAAEAEAKLKSEIEAIAEDRSKLNSALINTATRIRALEARLAASDERIKAFDDNDRQIRQSLDSRRSIIAEVLAALQRMGRRPPPALLVAPEDALQSVRTAMMLGAVLPEMRGEVQALGSDLAALVRVRKAAAAESESSSHDLSALSQDSQRMTLLIEERQKKQAETEQALQAQRERAAGLAREADNLKDLIAKLEQDNAASAAAAQAAGRADAKEGSGKPERSSFAALKDPGRLVPAISFAAAKGSLPLPVNGVKVREFGDTDRLGGSEKGLSIATRAGAQVTAPCDGWVVYAGPFRSYGQLLILNAGGGYHVLLAGMDRVSVDLGQFVLTGEPVAVMGAGPAAVVGAGARQPILYVEFRKDGTPVDPSPWWANESEKVRG
jgi:septal ring factor EnvC (AmiA/AmiB activator)